MTDIITCTFNKKGGRIYKKNGKNMPLEEGCKTDVLCKITKPPKDFLQFKDKEVNRDGFIVDDITKLPTTEKYGKSCPDPTQFTRTGKLKSLSPLQCRKLDYIKELISKYHDPAVNDKEIERMLEGKNMVEIRAITGKYITGSSSKQFKFPGDDTVWNLNNPTLPLIREWALRARRLMFIEMEEKGYRVSPDNAGVVVDSDNKEIKRISFMPKVIIQNSDDNYDDIKEEDIPSTIPLPNVNDVGGDSIRQKYETSPNRAVSQFKDTINNLFNLIRRHQDPSEIEKSHIDRVSHFDDNKFVERPKLCDRSRCPNRKPDEDNEENIEKMGSHVEYNKLCHQCKETVKVNQYSMESKEDTPYVEDSVIDLRARSEEGIGEADSCTNINNSQDAIKIRGELILRNFQKRLVEYFNSHDVFGFAAIHSTGSGKTMTSLVAAECYLQKHPEGRVIIVAKTSLLDHFWRELCKIKGVHCEEKTKIPLTDGSLKIFDKYFLWTYDKFANKAQNDLGMKAVKNQCLNSLLIIDEIHNLRNWNPQKNKYGKRWEISMTCAEFSRKRLLLTATPFVNGLKDFTSIINFIYGYMIIGNREDMIEGRVWDSIEKDDLEKIKNYLNPYYAESGVNLPLIDYIERSDKGFAKVDIHDLIIPIEEDFYDTYKSYLKGGRIANAIVFPSKNMFYCIYRQAVNGATQNGNLDYITTKLKAEVTQNIIKNAIENKEKTIIYTNFLNKGLEPLITVLKQLDNVTDDMYLSISGLTANKQDILDRYNNDDDILFLLMTSAGSEGLDVKPIHSNGKRNGVKNLIIMDPVWHPAGIQQIIGRAVRYQSHEEGETVNVYKLIIISPKVPIETWRDDGTSGDVKLYNIIDNKQAELNQVNEMLREISYNKEKIEQDVDYNESSPIMEESHNGNISDEDVVTWMRSLNDQELSTLKKLIEDESDQVFHVLYEAFGFNISDKLDFIKIKIQEL